MKDKYKLAFLVGMIAGFIMDIADYLFYFLFKLLGIRHILHAEYMAAMLLKGEAPANSFEFISGQIVHFVFTGVLASFYIFTLSFMKEKNNLFRGWLIGGIVFWFVFFIIGILFKVELFLEATMFTVIADFFTASSFGISIALFYKLFEKKYKLEK